MERRKIIIFIVLISLLNFKFVFSQTVSKIDTQIDSLETIKKDLEKKLKIINEKILALKNKKEKNEIIKINENKIKTQNKSKKNFTKSLESQIEILYFNLGRNHPKWVDVTGEIKNNSNKVLRLVVIQAIGRDQNSKIVKSEDWYLPKTGVIPAKSNSPIDFSLSDPNSRIKTVSLKVISVKAK